VSAAVPAERLDDAALVELAGLSSLEAISHLPRLDLDVAQLREIGFGRGFVAPEACEGELALAHDGELVAIAYCDGDMIRPRKVFPRG
jgi:hypothetical protein